MVLLWYYHPHGAVPHFGLPSCICEFTVCFWVQHNPIFASGIPVFNLLLILSYLSSSVYVVVFLWLEPPWTKSSRTHYRQIASPTNRLLQNTYWTITTQLNATPSTSLGAVAVHKGKILAVLLPSFTFLILAIVRPNPTAPYYLQIYTSYVLTHWSDLYHLDHFYSAFIVPFLIDAGSGLDFVRSLLQTMPPPMY